MSLFHRLHLSALACLTACTAEAITAHSDCDYDGDLSGGVQGTLSPYQTALNLGEHAPAAPVEVAVQLVGIDVGPVCRKEIRWTPGAGSGTVQSSSTMTSDGLGLITMGVAKTSWILPSVQGVTAATLTAEVVNSDPPLHVVFTASTTPPPAGIPTLVTRNPGTFLEPQSGTAGQPVTLPPSVKVTDFFGQPVVVQVTFTVMSGGGSLSATAAVTSLPVSTGTNGVATVPTWILGNPGVNTVQVTVGPLQPVTFTANAAAPPAPVGLTLAILAGDNQSAVVNSAVEIPPSVIIRNALGQGVAGVGVTWQVVQGTGSFTFHSPTTDAAGVARLDYFAPTTSGVVKLRATASSLQQITPPFVEFTITGLSH